MLASAGPAPRSLSVHSILPAEIAAVTSLRCLPQSPRYSQRLHRRRQPPAFLCKIEATGQGSPQRPGITAIWVKISGKYAQVGPLSPLAIWVGGRGDTWSGFFTARSPEAAALPLQV